MLRIFRGERHAAAGGGPADEQETQSTISLASDASRPADASATPASSSEPSAPASATSEQPADAPEPQSPAEPGFLARGNIRRRARFLRAARELAYRDLGGLVFDLHRFGQGNDEVLAAKLVTLGRIDTELRALEEALKRRAALTVLRRAGVSACPRCAAIHGSFDRFCPACGLPVRPDARPIAPTSPPADAAMRPPSPLGRDYASAAPSSAPQTAASERVSQPTQAFALPREEGDASAPTPDASSSSRQLGDTDVLDPGDSRGSRR
ncbi:MAG: zinc ribbon domain-containing protein [Solirubrobacteraceae bacterium]